MTRLLASAKVESESTHRPPTPMATSTRRMPATNSTGVSVRRMSGLAPVTRCATRPVTARKITSVNTSRVGTKNPSRIAGSELKTEKALSGQPSLQLVYGAGAG